jgi:23S rRNA maturation mini-RNase III
MHIKEVENKHKEAIKKIQVKAPPIILHNMLNAPEDVFKKFQKKYLEHKKELEVKVVKENKQSEIIDKIICRTDEQERDRDPISSQAKALI